jgi:hypothetical protein
MRSLIGDVHGADACGCWLYAGCMRSVAADPLLGHGPGLLVSPRDRIPQHVAGAHEAAMRVSPALFRSPGAAEAMPASRDSHEASERAPRASWCRRGRQDCGASPLRILSLARPASAASRTGTQQATGGAQRAMVSTKSRRRETLTAHTRPAGGPRHARAGRGSRHRRAGTGARAASAPAQVLRCGSPPPRSAPR